MAPKTRRGKNKQPLQRITEFTGGGETDFAEKAIQNFKLLLTNGNLLLDIQKYRDRWGVKVSLKTPVKEIPIVLVPKTRTTSEVEQYLLDAGTDTHTLDFENPDFSIPPLKNIKEAFEKERRSPPTEQEQIDKEARFNEIDGMMKKYKIDSIFFDIFKIFVNEGVIDSRLFAKMNPTGAYFFTDTNVNGEPSMNIRIFPETTLEDIQVEWPNIEIGRDKFLGFNLRKQAKRKNLDRDLRIFHLKVAGMSSKEIARHINKEYPNKKHILTYSSVDKIISQLKLLHENRNYILP